jgi:hypothetical protein
MHPRLNLRLLISVLVLLLVAAACEGPPPTQFAIEVTREVTREVTVVVVVTATPEDGVEVAEASEATAAPEEDEVDTPDVELTPDAFPTPVSEQIIVAEQLFERGRMFYLQPVDEIWVLIDDEEGADGGPWRRRQDTWEDGMPEFDPTIIPPDEDLYQPIRGFGKLWREDDAIRGALGWAIEDEYGHVTRYEYYAGGEVTAAGDYVPGPGQHTIVSRHGEPDTFVLNEVNGTWRRVIETDED